MFKFLVLVVLVLAFDSVWCGSHQAESRIQNAPPPVAVPSTPSSSVQDIPVPPPFMDNENQVLASMEERIDFEAHISISRKLIPDVETFHAKHGDYFRENFPFFFERVAVAKFDAYRALAQQSAPVMKLVDMMDLHGNKTLAEWGLAEGEKKLIEKYFEDQTPDAKPQKFTAESSIDLVYASLPNISRQLSTLEAIVEEDFELLQDVVSRTHRATFSPYWERVYAYIWPADPSNLAAVNGTQTLERHVAKYQLENVLKPLEKVVVEGPEMRMVADEVRSRSELMADFAGGEAARKPTFAQPPLTVAVQTVRMFQLSIRRLIQSLLGKRGPPL